MMNLNYHPVADVKVLAANTRITNWNGEKLFPAMMEQFRQLCRSILPCIGAAVERGNGDDAAHALHLFMGSCRLMGAQRLESMCASLRGMCMEGLMPEPREWAALAQAVGDYVDYAETYMLLSASWDA